MGSKKRAVKSKRIARRPVKVAARVTSHRQTRTTGSKAAKAREFVVKYIAQNGRGPTYTQVQEATGVGDTTQVFRKLSVDGVITYEPGDYTTARLCTDKANGAGDGLVVKLSPAVLAEVRAQLLSRRADPDGEIAAIDEVLNHAKAG